MIAFLTIMLCIAIIASWIGLFLYFRSVDALEKQRRRDARAEEYAQAQRRISHNRT